MLSLLSRETEGFLFTWKVKNVNVSFCEERILSPKFVAYNLYKSEWIMGLDPLSTQDGFILNLGMEMEYSLLKRISFIVNVTAIKPNGKKFGSKKTITFLRDGTLEPVASFHEFTLSEETIIFNCHIKKAREQPLIKSLLRHQDEYGRNMPVIRCIAHTHIGSEKICCIWRVRNLESMLPGAEKKYTLYSTASHSSQIKILGKLLNSSEFHTEVHVKTDERIFIVGKISVLTQNKDLEWSKVKGFLVENEFTSEMVFKFLVINIRDWDPDVLRNGDLELLCEFSFSTGSMHSEIDESNYLTKDFSDQLTNLPKENFEVNASTAETEKISTPDTEDGICSNENKSTPQTLKEDLKKFYLQKNHCDFTFQIGNEVFPAHKIILCSRSPVFCAMFDSGMKETSNKKVEIDDMEADTMNRFLLFLYSETLEDLTWDIATKLLYAANKYQVESLKVECTSFLLSNISVANVCEALKLSDLYQDEKMKSACLNLIFEHEAQIFSSSEWEMLTLENPLLSAKTLQNHFAMKK